MNYSTFQQMSSQLVMRLAEKGEMIYLFLEYDEKYACNRLSILLAVSHLVQLGAREVRLVIQGDLAILAHMRYVDTDIEEIQEIIDKNIPGICLSDKNDDMEHGFGTNEDDSIIWVFSKS